MTNNESHTEQKEAWERGYREALLDVYLFLTTDARVLSLDDEHFSLIFALAEQINERNGQLEIP